MSEALTSAVILAAGRGTRMGEVTEEIPKPMLPIAGRPMLEHILERLESAGLNRFLLIVGYKGKLIEKHFANAHHHIASKVQDPVDGTATATLLARDFTGDQPFLLTYGDILCDAVEYTRMLEFLEKHPSVAAIVAVKEVEDPWQGAAVYELAGQITRIVEKPPKGSSVTRWNSAGIYLFKPSIFDYLQNVKRSPRGEYELPSALGQMVQDRLPLIIFPVRGRWQDVGRPEDLKTAQEQI